MKDKIYQTCSLFTLLLSVTACSGDRLLESRLTADPRLKNSPSPILTPYSGLPPFVTASPTVTTTPLPTPTVEEKLPPIFNKYVEDLSSLGIITTQENFSAPITRREYLRWLIKANNRFYSNQPSLQIRPASTTSIPLFKDLNNSDPDFPLIQGLAEAGIIPSTLTKDNNAFFLRPDAPLTRETLIHWKVPLDYRKAIPVATLETIKSSWGLSDANLIDPKVWSTLYVDYQNGEASNLRRALGYTVLLQPKKLVTHAEAAATLWSFGFQDTVLTAVDVLKTEAIPSPSPSAIPNNVVPKPSP